MPKVGQGTPEPGEIAPYDSDIDSLSSFQMTFLIGRRYFTAYKAVCEHERKTEIRRRIQDKRKRNDMRKEEGTNAL